LRFFALIELGNRPKDSRGDLRGQTPGSCSPARTECCFTRTRSPRCSRSFSEAAGVRRIRLHDVRHGYATLALKAGTHPKVVQQRLGHSSIMVTLDIYSHVLDELDDQAATVLLRAMEG
jgi:integrase